MLQDSGIRETRHAARELKFLVPVATTGTILAWCRARLAPDPHASGEFSDEYQTHSLYFDTETLDVYHRRGSFGRCKYRIRRYGVEPVVFLERKLRTSACLTKRRTPIGLDDLRGMERPERNPGWAGHWFQERVDIRRLRPACQITYRRVARVISTTEGLARLTIDREIMAQPIDGLEFRPTGGVPVLGADVILEMKFRREAPAVFREVVEVFNLEPMTISKYRLSVEALRASEGVPVASRRPGLSAADVLDA
jgi:hypothetical protein